MFDALLVRPGSSSVSVNHLRIDRDSIAEVEWCVESFGISEGCDGFK